MNCVKRRGKRVVGKEEERFLKKKLLTIKDKKNCLSKLIYEI